MSETRGDDGQRHVVVSGGSRGLGQVLVEGLLRSGYRVSSFSRNRTEFVDRQADDPCFYYEAADLCDAGTLARFLDGARSRFGPPHGLVNCAGVAIVGVLALLRDDQIDQAIGTNLRGTLTLTRAVVGQMRTQQGEDPSSTSPRLWDFEVIAAWRSMPRPREASTR